MSDLATLRIVVSADKAIRAVDQFGNAVEVTGKKTDGLTRATRGLVAGLGAMVGSGAVLRKVIDESSAAQAAQAQLAAAIRSTGGVAGQTADALNEHAAALQRVTTYGDDAVTQAQALLLSFTKVGGDTFPRATEAILDVATALGTDLRSAALQVGKALNDPLLGMTALSRSGIQFSEAQKAAVKQLVATNRVAEAQVIVLKELATQFGGSARAARDTLGGAITSLNNAIGDLFEMDRSDAAPLIGALEYITDSVTDLGLTWKVTFAEMEVAALKLTDVLDQRFAAGVQRNVGAALFGITGGKFGAGMIGAGIQRDDRTDALVSSLEQYLLGLQRELAARGAGGRGGSSLGGRQSADPLLELTYSSDKFTASVKAALVATSDFAQTIDDNLRQKTLASLRASLDEIKASEEARSVKAREAFKERLAEVKQESDALGETARVFTEQTQLALGRFGSDFLKDGFKSLDRFWGDFVQLGRDAIGNVFAKSVMDRLGDGLTDGIGGLLGKVGGVGGGIIGAVGLGIGASLDRIFGESKWERAAEEHRRAARALQEAAGDLRNSTVQSQAQWLDDFLNYANTETPLAKELRGLTNRRNELALQALGIARTATNGAGLSSSYAQSLITANDWTALAGEARNQAMQGNLLPDGRKALLEFADALDRLNGALADNREAALRARDAQQELTFEQFRDSLGADATGRLSSSQRLAEAQRQYEAILALARGGDASAVDSLPETARTLIDAARETFASGVRFQELFAGVQTDVDALLAEVRARAALPLEDATPATVPIDYVTTPGVDASGVGFDYVTTDALVTQTDRALEVANAQLSVQQQGFQGTIATLQQGFVDLGVRLQSIDFLLRNRPETAVSSTVGFDYARTE